MRAAKAQAEFGQGLALDPTRSPAVSSNRRFKTRCNVEANAKALAPDPTYKLIKHACETALVLWPDAKAAVLFGSRARGNHRNDSDWDIAFVTNKEESLPGSVIGVFTELREHLEIEVQALAISQVQFHEDANSLGSIAAPIVREGRILAGHCKWPKTESEPVLKPDDYQDWRGGALGTIATATMHLATAIDNVRRGKDRSAFKKFVADSSDAAEFCAKIAFGRLASGTGSVIPRKHQVNDIVKLLDQELARYAGPNAKWWQSDNGKKFREMLCRMNGHGDDDHQFGYPRSKFGAEAIGRAANRLIATASFAILEVEEFPEDGELRHVAREVAATQWTFLQMSVRRLRQALQDFDSSDSTPAAADSIFVESVSVAVTLGEEIVQAIEKLADNLYADMESERRDLVNPLIYVVGFRPDGKSVAIADTPEAIMDSADEISGTKQLREGAGMQLAGSSGFNQSLRIHGFTLEPDPLLLSPHAAMDFVRTQKELDTGETKLREALAKLLRAHPQVKNLNS